MKEELEMYSSKYLVNTIEKAREEIRKGKYITLVQVKKKLKLSTKAMVERIHGTNNLVEKINLK